MATHSLRDAILGPAAPNSARIQWDHGLRDGPHLTFAFLGHAVPPPDVAALAQRLGQALAAVPARLVGLRGVGAFPTPREARVAWVAVQEEPPCAGTGTAPDAALADVATAVQEAASPWLRPGLRPFVAHLTLARLDPPADLTAWTARHAGTAFATGVAVDHVAIVAWRTGGSGPRHSPLAHVPLAAAAKQA